MTLTITSYAKYLLKQRGYKRSNDVIVDQTSHTNYHTHTIMIHLHMYVQD